MKKFIIINPFGIGDVLFTTPVMRAIKDAYPDAFIGYWCNERVTGLLKDNSCINIIFALSRGDLKKIHHQSKREGIYKFFNLLFQIKKEKFEVALDFSLDHRYSLITKILGIRKRVGFNYKGRGIFLTDKIDTQGYSSKHMVEYYLDLLTPLDIKPKRYDLDLKVSEDIKIKSKDMLNRCGVKNGDLLIGIAPGAGESWGKDASIKRWPDIKFAQLADRIKINFAAAKIIILGDESERPIADIIVKATKDKPIDLTGKTTLEELAGVINNLGLLIANDGGPLHIAVAQGIKTVSIFGPVDDLVYGPYPFDNNRHIVLRKTLDCSPCYQNFRLGPCLKNRECLQGLEVEEVLNAVHKLLD